MKSALHNRLLPLLQACPEHYSRSRTMRGLVCVRIRPIFWIFTLLLSGCDPVISVAGANFPVWLMCVVAGILVSLCLRPIFVAMGIDQWMAPRPMVYSCLALVIAFLCWLL